MQINTEFIKEEEWGGGGEILLTQFLFFVSFSRLPFQKNPHTKTL
jgi:hypothetical protein